MHILTIEGNIGAGKSTIMAHLKSCRWHQEEISVVLIDEPVQEWLDQGLLQDLYDKNITAEAFQYAALSSIVSHTRKVMMSASPGTTLFIAERSVGSNLHVFAQASLREEPQRRAFKYAYDQMVSMLPTNMVFQHLMLNTDPEICLDRIKARARISESAITLEYLQQLHDLHNEWIDKDNAEPGAPKWHTIDASKDRESVLVDAMGTIKGIVAALEHDASE